MANNSKTPKRRSQCPISFGLDLFGDKWTLLILRDILFFNKQRFSDFARHEKIASNVLAQRLQRLEDAGVLSKTQDEVLRNQNVYTITEKGNQLLPTLIDLMLWGFCNDAKSLAGKQFIARVASERSEVVAEVAAAVADGKFLKYRETEMGVAVKAADVPQ